MNASSLGKEPEERQCDDGLLPGTTARPSIEAKIPTAYGGRLLRRYAAYMAGLLSVGLLASGGIGAYFTYLKTRALVDELQREQARSAAVQIEQFIQNVERQLRGVMIVSRAAEVPAQDSHYVELIKLLRLAPAVSDAAWLNPEGHERALVSRLGRDIVAGDKDRSRDPGFLSAQAGQIWHGKISFRRQSEPYLAVAVPGDRRDDGVVLADINLRFVSEVITRIPVGTSGHAYVVDEEGRLISHRDASKALRMSSLADLPQVRAALTWQRGPALLRPTIIADNEIGQRALTASAPIVSLGWHVLVEQPLSEAFAPVYGSLARAALLLVLGVALAVVASVALARRMTTPIRALEIGAQRIGEGRLEERVELDTEDELQGLADQFNRMAEKLRESYAGLEGKIAERTRQLEEANRDKARFLAAASHDLRQPVNALGLFVAQLQETHDEGTRARLVDKVAASSAAVSDLIEALLDISKLDAGTVEFQPTEFSLQPLFDRIEHALAPAAQEKGLRLRVRATRLRALTDPVLLERILLNLCANAIRYTSQGGAIVTARLRNGDIRIEVRDTGIGIAPEQQRRIFEEFYQIDALSDGRSPGLGLGLAIVDRLARLLGLRVQVRSQPERGSVFALDVPRARSTDGARMQPTEALLPIRFEALPILLIDDDPLAREATAGLLAQWGCRVFTAANATEALQQIHPDAGMPRLIICDYRLGADEPGTEVVRRIRDRAAVEIPAVIVTADAGPEPLQAVAAAGLHLMRKPLNAARLRAFLTHVAETQPPHGAESLPGVRDHEANP